MQKQTGVVPDALLKRPGLPAPLVYYIRAFYDISRGRQMTMGGAGPIALSEILAYMQIHEIEGLQERAAFMRLMLRLDTVYLEHQAKKQELRKSQEK